MDKRQKAYQEQVEAQLKVWAAQIAELKAKAEKSEAKAKVSYYDHVEELQTRAEEVRSKLNQLKNAGADSWEGLKGGVEKVIHDVREA